MEKINYKYVSIALATLLIANVAWNYSDRNDMDNMDDMKGMSGKMNMQNMYKMPNGEMMMDDGSMVKGDMGSMTMDDMVNDLKGKTGRDLEKAFIVGMVPHHQGAVDMAKLILQDKTLSPKFVKFANDIIKAQEGEIKMMNEWAKGY